MRVAVYGGSFNPPHLAHAMVASWLCWTELADAVWLVPVYRHAFEGTHGKTLAPYERRVQWCRQMAAQLGPHVAVSTIEEGLSVPSYTIDTLRALARTQPQHRFRLVVGADVMPQVPSWRHWDQIAAEFAPIVVGRAGHPMPEGTVGVDFPDISSTEIRQRIRRGADISHLVPACLDLCAADFEPG